MKKYYKINILIALEEGEEGIKEKKELKKEKEIYLLKVNIK